MLVADIFFLASLNRHIGMSDQVQLSREAHTVLPLVSLSLLPLAIATWAIYCEIRSTPGRSPRSALLTSFGIVASLALMAGLVHVVVPAWMPSVPAWQGWGCTLRGRSARRLPSRCHEKSETGKFADSGTRSPGGWTESPRRKLEMTCREFRRSRGPCLARAAQPGFICRAAIRSF